MATTDTLASGCSSEAETHWIGQCCWWSWKHKDVFDETEVGDADSLGKWLAREEQPAGKLKLRAFAGEVGSVLGTRSTKKNIESVPELYPTVSSFTWSTACANSELSIIWETKCANLEEACGWQTEELAQGSSKINVREDGSDAANQNQPSSRHIAFTI